MFILKERVENEKKKTFNRLQIAKSVKVLSLSSSILMRAHTIPNHQEIEAHKQAEEAPEVRDEGLKGVGHLLLLRGQGRARESDADDCRVRAFGRDHERVSRQLNKG